MPVYRWEWTVDDGSTRKVEISTFRGLEAARETALGYFPDDEKARHVIMNTDPVIIPEA